MNELPSGLRWSTHGDGDPVTIIIPGLGATSGEARIPASGLVGTRVVATLPNHGDARDGADDYWDYQRIAEDVATLADKVGARHAIGTSLGAGALMRLLSERPDRFDAVGLLLPAAIDQPRETPAMWAFEGFADAVDAGDRARLCELVAAEIPAGVDVGGYVEARADALSRLAVAMRSIPEQVPVPDRASLAEIRADVVVVGAVGDPLHAESVAREVAALIPGARLTIFDSSAPLLSHRKELRELLRTL